MYDEDSYKRYILAVKVKKIFIMITFCVIGAILGVLISSYVVDILLFSSGLKVVIITISTLIFLAISFLLTSGASKEVQDGYWKIAVLRKLTLISKKLDTLENLKYLENLNLTTKQIESSEPENSLKKSETEEV